MFILDKNKFGDSDLRNAKEFIEFWNNYYHYEVKVLKSKDNISYIDELNLRNDLTEQNVKRLLRWKDHRWLTEEILSGPNKGAENDKVISVLKKLESLNGFRHGRNDENSFLEIVKEIFPTGLIWGVFLFHIARPYQFPIADQNVFQAFSIQTNNKIPEDWEDWEGYKEYKKFFFKVAKSAGIIDRQPKGNENNLRDIVWALKEVDKALFVFGKFLSDYDGK